MPFSLTLPLEPEPELELSPINDTRLLFCGNTKKGVAVGSINTACAALFFFCGTGGEPELDVELAPTPFPELGLVLKATPETALELKREAELEPEPELVIGPTPAKNGVRVGSINTACAALLNLWDGGGRGDVLIMLGVGVLPFEEKERNVLCEEEEEWNGWEGLEGEGVVAVLGLARVSVSFDLIGEGGWREERERWMNGCGWVLFEATEGLSGTDMGELSAIER